jgi:hypothetical protein
MTWKPIDAAPHDGREIVVAYRRPRNGAVVVSAFEAGEWRWHEDAAQDAVLTSGDIPFAWTEKPE